MPLIAGQCSFPISRIKLGERMNEHRRLYPTVQEERELEEVKRRLGLEDTDISKGAGMPRRAPRKDSSEREQPDRQ